MVALSGFSKEASIAEQSLEASAFPNETPLGIKDPGAENVLARRVRWYAGNQTHHYSPVRFLRYFLVTATISLAANVGDTYKSVIAEKGAPKSEIDAGSLRMLGYPDMTIKLRDGIVISIKPISKSEQAAPAATNATGPRPPQMDTVKRQLDDAVAQVKTIINQPVPYVPATPEMGLGYGLFHPGAQRPDFNTVDVRQSQEGMFDSSPLISWEGTMDKAWVGKDIEFNAMTKYFYEDRSLPKKKLTEAEMLEINRLYRIIGKCEQQLAQMGYKGTVP